MEIFTFHRYILLVLSIGAVFSASLNATVNFMDMSETRENLGETIDSYFNEETLKVVNY